MKIDSNRYTPKSPRRPEIGIYRSTWLQINRSYRCTFHCISADRKIKLMDEKPAYSGGLECTYRKGQVVCRAGGSARGERGSMSRVRAPLGMIPACAGFPWRIGLVTPRRLSHNRPRDRDSRAGCSSAGLRHRVWRPLDAFIFLRLGCFLKSAITACY